MRKKKLGNTDLELTVIGLGTWAIGGNGWDYGWGAQNDSDSVATIIEALETGINWIDTAAVYGLGHSEEVVGKALKEWGGKVIIATKCGLLGDCDGHVKHSLKKDSIIKEVDGSLKRLNVDIIDLYQIHWPYPSSEIEEGFETLLKLKEQGKICYSGISNFSVKQMERISKFGNIASLQPPYSIINRRIENDVLPYCKNNNIGVICYSPLQCGLLTGKVTKEWLNSLPDDDWRKAKSEFFREPQLSANLKVVDKLKKYALEKGYSIKELVISWVLRRDEVTAAIVGARKNGQIQETVKAFELILNSQEIDELEQIVKY